MQQDAVAVSDDGKPVMNAAIMRRAMEYSKIFDMLVISHCEDSSLSAKGVMNEGIVSTELGLRGIPRCSRGRDDRTGHLACRTDRSAGCISPM